MVKDQQVRRLMKLIKEEKTLAVAASKVGMDEKTARKYRRTGLMPSQMKCVHTWRTRPDPFDDTWDEIRGKLSVSPGLMAKTLFEDLQRKDPGRFQDGQLRTLQRRIKVWRALEGPAREVYFPQVHYPGELSESDFTHMTSLGVTIQGQAFPHLLYHFVLTYSNWETGTVCFSESYESLSEGLQNALWELGGAPREHKTDRLTAAVNKIGHPEAFTRRYEALLRQYGLVGRPIQGGKANENGDVEQRHYRFKQAVDQTLMLRGSREFNSREDYSLFLRNLFEQLNAGRRDRFLEELAVLRGLPAGRLHDLERILVRVGPSSTIRVKKNVYSVDSRLEGEELDVHLYADRLDLWYAQRVVESLPRLRGESKHSIQYRHIIDWLVRKPGAFENYRYRDDLFPSSRFRMAYDWLRRNTPCRSSKEYLRILELAAKESESGVDDALRYLIEEELPISFEAVDGLVRSGREIALPTEVTIAAVNLEAFDELLVGAGVCP